jgi:hypothetical protein
MEKMLERAVLLAYRRAVALGADGMEAFETALGIVFDARPDIEEGVGRGVVATIVEAARNDESPPIAAGAMLRSRYRATIARSSTNGRSRIA